MLLLVSACVVLLLAAGDVRASSSSSSSSAMPSFASSSSTASTSSIGVSSSSGGGDSSSSFVSSGDGSGTSSAPISPTASPTSVSSSGPPCSPVAPATPVRSFPNHGLATQYVVDDDGNMYGIDESDHSIIVLATADGSLLASFQLADSHPTAIARSADGTLYVVDSLNNRVMVVSSSGVVLRNITDGLSLPMGVTVDPVDNDRLYVVDCSPVPLCRVVVLSASNGTTMRNISWPDQPIAPSIGVDASSGWIVAVGGEGYHSLRAVAPNGTSVFLIDNLIDSYPSGLEFGADGRAYMIGGNNAWALSVSNRALSSWSYFFHPVGVAVDSALYIYMNDGNQITVLAPLDSNWCPGPPLPSTSVPSFSSSSSSSRSSSLSSTATSSNSGTPPNSNADESSLSPGAIAGIVLGSVCGGVLLLAVCMSALLYAERKQTAAQAVSEQPEVSVTVVQPSVVSYSPGSSSVSYWNYSGMRHEGVPLETMDIEGAPGGPQR